MVFIYVLSFAQGSLPHGSCENHETRTLHHENQIHDSEESSDELCHSKGIMHSFVHLFESLAHSQFAHDEPMVVEANGSNFYFIDFVFEFSLTERQIPLTSVSNIRCSRTWHSDFHLLHSPLRGPPTIV